MQYSISQINTVNSNKSYSLSNLSSDTFIPFSNFTDVFPQNIASKIETLFSSSTSFTLPEITLPGVRYINNSVIIFEKPPRYENIFLTPMLVNDIGKDSETFLYRIPIPWQVYVIEYVHNPDATYAVDVRMFFRNSSLNSFDDKVYLPPLTNFYADAKLCRPMYDSIDDVNRYPDTINGIIQEAYDWIWNSGTNIDLSDAICSYYRYSYWNKDFCENSITKHCDSQYLAYYKNYSAYYCNSNSVKNFFEVWSNIPLKDICDMNWIYPYDNSQSYASLTQRLINLSPMLDLSSFYKEGCCEDCEYCDYDDDGDVIDSYCGHEECPCHDASSNLENVLLYCASNKEHFDKINIPFTLDYFIKNICNPSLNSSPISKEDIFQSLKLSCI